MQTMANYSIKEMFEFQRTDSLFKDASFMVQWAFDPPENPETPDTRPDFIKSYVDTNKQVAGMLDELIAQKYAHYVFCTPCDDVEEAYTKFFKWNSVYCITHDAELKFIYKAYTDEFNPRDNYDRREETTVTTDMTIGATSKTSPDDNELFYNVGSGETSTDGDVTTESHITGNIGVVDAPTMAKNVLSFFGGSGWMEYFIERLIMDNCILVD